MVISKIFVGLYAVWCLSELGLLAKTYTGKRGGERSDRGSLLLLWVVIFSSIWIGLTVGGSRPHTMFGGARWLAWVSLGMMVAGLAVRWTAILTLGKSFSVNVAIHATQTVKRTGIFRFARHPSYTGLLLILAALGVNTRNWLALGILVAPPTLALLYRIHVEEKALNAAFGADYADYSKATKRLVPGIY